MGEKLRGWEEKEKVLIPPLETNGFASDVIIRAGAPNQRAESF